MKLDEKMTKLNDQLSQDFRSHTSKTKTATEGCDMWAGPAIAALFKGKATALWYRSPSAYDLGRTIVIKTRL